MAEFRTIHTTAGLTAMAAAEATGTSINLTHMAVGDGNGNPVTPTEGQAVLPVEPLQPMAQHRAAAVVVAALIWAALSAAAVRAARSVLLTLNPRRPQ